VTGPWTLGLEKLFTAVSLTAVLRTVVVLVLGLALARLLGAAAEHVIGRRTSAQSAMLLRRAINYVLVSLVIFGALNSLGIELGFLLGAAGVLTVALGFASQTSASNLISGLFLVVERPFVVGDVITVDDVTGEVLTIDLLSTKLRTFDNLYVRVPNETIIKSRVTNQTHFPIRRIDLHLGVAYHEDLARVRAVLDAVAAANPLCLDNPQPLFIVQGFGDSAQQFQFSVWATRENYLEVRNAIQLQIKAAFARENIAIPYPHRALHLDGGPLPVRVIEAGRDGGGV
jgi:small-conductance mechanosensitive channel